MVRTNPTLRSLGVLALLLTVCCVGAAFMRAHLCRPAIAGGRIPAARLLWDMPASGFRSISFSPSGRYISTVSRSSEVACYDSSGTKLFLTVVPGADKAVTSPEGDCTVAYSHMNRAHTRLTFLDAKGRVHWQMDVSGSIWSADAANRGDEACFAVGTGSRHVYLIRIRGASKRYRRWRAPGVVCSVSLSADCRSLFYGTWQRSSVSRSDLAGHKEWQLDRDPAYLHYVESLNGSDRLFARSIANRQGNDGEVWLVESDGSVRNKLPLGASERTSAMPSPDGYYICTGYTKSIRHSAKTTQEKHVALYDLEGRKLWDKGSLMFPTTPVLVTKGGCVLLAGSKNSIMAVSPAGEVKQVCKLPSAVNGSVPSRDGLRALLLCADGRVRFLQVLP